ncbi:hypothetical protein W02_22230 [Nitrospira sp. KM1]|nr:hypothetical protein W02_22230 [Nitrospira sp. KM1]
MMLLQLVLVMVYAFYLAEFSYGPADPGVIVKSMIMSAALLTVLTAPSVMLSTPQFISALTLLNAGVLMSSIPRDRWTDPGMVCGTMLLLSMISYARSTVHFVAVGGILLVSYSVLLIDRMHPEAILLVPALLCMTLVLLNRTGRFHEQTEHPVRPSSRSEAAHDSLTGLPNRAQFLEQVERIIQYRYVNKNFHFAILFIDLDGFKPINDTFGHKAGDIVLRQIAKVLQGCVRKGDLVGRYGGDEFTILLNNIKESSDTVRIAEILLSRIQTPIAVGETVRVGASIGIALSTNLHECAEDLIRDADAAMYRAKARGKNCFVISDQSDLSKAEVKERWKRITQFNWLLRNR